MKPIISPWIFYFTGMSNALLFILIFAAICFLTAFIVFMIIRSDERDCYNANEERINKLSKSIKRCFIVTIICTLLAVLTPTEDTIYKMLAAKYATPDNIETVYDKIIDGAAELGKAWHGDKEKEK